MTRRERREAEERAREEALRGSGRSGDTVVVGGITFHGPAPISPAVGTPVAPPGAVRRSPALPQGPVVHGPAPRAARPQHLAPPAPQTLAADPAPRQSPRRAAVAHDSAPQDLAQQAPVLPPRAAHPAAASIVPPRPLTTPSLASRPAPVAGPAPTLAVEPTAAVVVAPAVTSAPAGRCTLPTRAELAGRVPRAVPVDEPVSRRRPWLPRIAVLGALAAATIAAPFAPTGALSGEGGSPFDLDLAPVGPSTLDVVSARVPTTQVAQGIAAAPVLSRDVVVASRSQDRDPLPGCDASVGVTSTNGKLTDGELCDLPFAPGERLSTRAAVALTALNAAFRDEFGVDIALVDSYRSLGQQHSVKASRGYLAARPGTSMHGLGLAIDLASSVTGSSEAYKWLVQNGAAYGWENPPWARRGGSGNYEPWHFEFRPGVEEVSTWH